MRTRFYDWSSRHRLIITLVIVGLIGATLTAIAIHGTSPRTSVATGRHSAPSASNPSYPLRTTRPTSQPVTQPPRATTNDPSVYARQLAITLFTVNPAQTSRAAFLRSWQSELPTVVYSDASAKGLTLARQNADAMQNLTRWWVPSPSAWTSEARDHTVSSLRITSVTVPDYWADAVAEGKFRDPGLRMERVMGVLTQTYGTNPTRRYRNSRPIVIDLALLCGPTQPNGCRLVSPQAPPTSGTA